MLCRRPSEYSRLALYGERREGSVRNRLRDLSASGQKQSFRQDCFRPTVALGNSERIDYFARLVPKGIKIFDFSSKSHVIVSWDFGIIICVVIIFTRWSYLIG